MEFNFGDSMEVTALDAVPTEFHGFYAEKGDKSGFAVRTDDPVVKAAVGNIQKLRSTVGALRGEMAGLKGRKSADLSLLGDFGTTVEEIAEGIKGKITGLEEQVASKEKGGKSALDKVRQEMTTANETALKQKDVRIEALTGQLYRYLVETEGHKAIESEVGNAMLLMPHIKSKVQVSEEDGEFRVFVVDDKREKRFSGTTGVHMSLRELVAEMKMDKAFAPAFTSDKPSGPGGNQQQQSRQNQTTTTPMSSVSKIRSGLDAMQGGRR